MMPQDAILNSSNWKDFEQSLRPIGKTEKGRAFEELTRLYLLAEPTFSTKITKIWHHFEIPQTVLDELDLERRDIGIDLIAKVKDGTYWAIQCKFHQDRTRNVSYGEVSTFFSMTERNKTFSKLSHRLICTSANGVSSIVHKKHPEKLGYLTSADFSKLGKPDFDDFHKLLDGGDLVLAPYCPRPHQSVALKKCDRFFNNEKNTRGKIIHPCGSGKSLIGYWISQKLKSKTILIAVPSLALVRQTLASWTREAVANGIDMDWIAVCSDDDVKNSDDPSMRKVDLGIEVDTAPQVIADFLSNSAKDIKVLITTYQSGQAVSEGVKKAKAETVFDLGIYDEAHKTVGQKDKPFAHLLFEENVKVKKRVLMTATERQFKGNSDEYLSMDDAAIYGTIIDELSFKAALEQKEPILSDYKIVTTIITKSDIEQHINNNSFVKSDDTDWAVEGDASTFASLIALRKLIKKHNLKHIVSFHNSIKRSKEFQALNDAATKADNNFGELSTFHVSGKDSTGDRAAELERFVDAKPSLITNARCLTEGIDVPAIDAVLFADPKQSKIDIVQAAGRALRKFDGKDFGYIIVPVVLDEESKDPSDDAFKQIITVISALGMSDERIIEEFRAIANGENRRAGRIIDIDVPDDALEIVRMNFADLISNIEIQIWDRLSYGWHKGFEQLKKYVKQNDNAKVPLRYIDSDGFNLGSWVSSRRREYNNNKLDEKKVKQLASVKGWVWDPLEADFQDGFERLKKYVKQNDSARVSQGYKDSDGFNLGSWVSSRRREYNNNKLDEKKVKQLASVKGWVWDPLEADFQDGFERLKQYVKQNDNARVPAGYKDSDGFNLGSWVNNRRNDYKNKKLDPQKAEQLASIKGWVWDPLEADFEFGLGQLKKYVKQNDNARVPNRYIDSDGFPLGIWVSSRRNDYKNKKLDPQKAEQLASVKGWVWDPFEADFQDSFEQLKKYVERNDNAKVPQGYIDSDGFNLGRWVSHRRDEYRNNKLDPQKVKQLASVKGWVWDATEANFQDGLERLNKYVKQNDNAKVPRRYIDSDGFKLGSWVRERRTEYKQNRLDPQKVRQLESVKGWVWDQIEANFQDGFERLKKYVEQNDNARVPRGYNDSDGFNLGSWVSSRRKDYKNDKLDPQKVKQLASVKGWVWDPLEADFQDGLERLKKYVEQNDNAIVPAIYKNSDGFNLGSWVSSRRAEYKQNKLDEKKVKQLASVKGWVWDPLEANFQDGLERLNKYVEQNDNAIVPAIYKNSDGFPLGSWVSSRRAEYKQNKLDEKKVKQLASVKGWVWDPLEANFQDGLERLNKYVEQNDNAIVPAIYKNSDGFPLGSWVSSRRAEYKQNKLDEKKVKQLASVKGWVWDPLEANFQDGLERLKKYVEQNDNAKVPYGYKDSDDFKLGSWVSSRRKDYKNDKLDPQKVKQLASIKGWVWDARQK